MSFVFEVDSANELRDEIVRVLEHMESNQRQHRVFPMTKKEAARWDAEISTTAAIAEMLRRAQIRAKERL
jgi:hypothetical protein